jgi:hypothetical protein
MDYGHHILVPTSFELGTRPQNLIPKRGVDIEKKIIFHEGVC